MIKNKINAIFCGGGAINVSDKVFRNIEELGDGFSGLTMKYIDTSKNNIDKIDHTEEDFWMIKSNSFSKNTISGSGSERSTNSKNIAEDVKMFLDSNGITKPVVGEYYLVITSGGGGSGSVIAPYLTKYLLDRNIPTIVLMMGDSSNGLSASNTLKTLASFSGIANKSNKALCMIYVNNHTFMDKGISNAIKEANKRIFNSVGALSLFLSGVNGDLDSEDMHNIIDQSKYVDIRVEKGLYGLASFTGEIELPEGTIPLVGRTLAPADVSPDVNATLLHHKAGTVVEPNALDVYGDQFPIHLITYANFFTVEKKMLEKVVKDYDNIMKSIVIEDMTIDSDEDEDGLVI